MTKFNSRAPLEKINQLQQSNQDQIHTLIGQLAYTDAITFLFDLSVYFEEQYAHLGPDKRMQVVGLWLSKLVKAAFNKKALPSPKKPDEAVQIQLLNRLVHLNETGLDETLMKLCQLYDSNEFLDTFQQIHQHDDNCEVLAYEEGCIRTVIKEGRFAGLQHYIRDGLKYEKLVDYYFNKGRAVALGKIISEELSLPGDTEDGRADAFGHAAHQIAAQSYLEHYGVEPEFTLSGEHYHTTLLVQLLSFLITYTQSRYGISWEQQSDEGDVVRRIVKVWEANQEEGLQTPGPLFVSNWDEFIERAAATFEGKWSRTEIERHLAFFSTRLDSPLKYLNIFEKPLLLLNDKVVFFARPLMVQNSWASVLLPLIKAIRKKQPEGANDRVKRSTEILGQKFREHGFLALTDEDLIEPGTNDKKVTDIDLLALKEDHLFVIQIKMTYPRATLQEAQAHRKVLVNAGEQVKRSVDYLTKYWPDFRSRLDTQKDWEELKVVPLVMSTSFEYDREQFSGYLKISQFELERYLENDVHLFFAGTEQLLDQAGWEKEFQLYPCEDKLSAERLRELIEGNVLWSFLDPCVLATPVDGFLPALGFPDTPAAQAEAFFKKGNTRYNQGSYAQAATYYRQAISCFPGNEEYHKGLGNALASEGKRRKSLVHFDKAIELNPCFGEAYNARGLTYHELRQAGLAIKDLRKAIIYTSWDISAWVHLAQALFGHGEMTDSLQLIEEARRTTKTGLMIFDHLPPEKQEMYQGQAKTLNFLAQL